MHFTDESKKPQQPGRLLLQVRDIKTGQKEYLVGRWIEHGGYWAAQTLIDRGERTGVSLGHQRMPADLVVLAWAAIEDA